MQRPLRALRGEQRAVQEGLRVLLQAGLVLGQQEEGECQAFITVLSKIL